MVAPVSDEFTETRARLMEAARALRIRIPDHDPPDLRPPSFEEQVAAYPALTEEKTRFLWNRWLRAMEAWLEAAPPEELRRGPVLEQLLHDGVRLGDRILGLVNEIKFNTQQGTNKFGQLANLKNVIDRKAHESWDIAILNTVEQDLILSTEESLCRFDRMLLDEKPAGALLLGVFVSRLQLVSPSRYLDKSDPCAETTKRRLMLYLQLIHLELLSREDLTTALPWLRGMVRLLSRVSDSGLLPPGDRVTFLEELVAHLEHHEEGMPDALREEFWRRLLAEVWRAPFRDPNAPRDRALALIPRTYPRWAELAAVSPEGARELLTDLQSLAAQNFISEIPELDTKLTEVEALVESIAPTSVETGA
jgi:hypothetical protein